MRHVLLAMSFAALTACGQAPAADQALTVAPEGVAPAGPTAGIDGWEIDMTAYGQIGATLPAFAGKLADGKEIVAESLRGHWTILGVWADGAVPRDEDTFAAALNSAVDQDPDLDLLIIQRAPADGSAAQAHPWPTLVDPGVITTGLNVPSTPAYLLIGPDLTIEGYRGALTATPDDGIKSVIRGVAEIRKQIAAPQ